MKGGKISQQVVEPYAEALMSVAQAHNLTAEFGEDIKTLLTLLQDSPELAELLSNPLVKAESKKTVLQQILGNEGNTYLSNFLMLLVDRRRIMFLPAIGEKYLELLRKLNNIVLAEITSATEMSEAQSQAVVDKIKSLTGAAGVELQTTVDPDLLGGVVIKVGSQVYDTSIRGQLRRITLNLSKAS
jgi:F-type H+-transporting ATPase subunit delta